jgi:hypothetical protein
MVKKLLSCDFARSTCGTLVHKTVIDAVASRCGIPGTTIPNSTPIDLCDVHWRGDMLVGEYPVVGTQLRSTEDV